MFESFILIQMYTFHRKYNRINQIEDIRGHWEECGQKSIIKSDCNDRIYYLHA